jgi:hypothetical protein
MKKMVLALILLLPLLWGCHKSKPAEVEMELPTPLPEPTVLVAASPTALTAVASSAPTAEAAPFGYTIEDIKGTGLIIPSGSTVPESAAEGESVETDDQLITKDDSEMTVALNDNTMIHIPADSRIKVVSLTPNSSQGFSSRIELLLGSVLSEVEKLSESKSSFEIEAGGVVCAVRGTAFEVLKQGNYIGTKTYHGTVEMQKGSQVEQVKENEHSTFALGKSSFLPQRRLTAAEQKHYQSWLSTKKAVQAKRENRITGGAKPVHRPAKKAPHSVNHKAQNIRKRKPVHAAKPVRHPGHPSKARNVHPRAKPRMVHPSVHRPQPRRPLPKARTPKPRHGKRNSQIN